MILFPGILLLILVCRKTRLTGSAHCTLIPYWAEKLGKEHLRAYQLSKRGGEIFCYYQGERVKISGEAALYAKGEIWL